MNKFLRILNTSVLVLFLVFSPGFSLIPLSVANASDGSPGDPWLVSDCDDLQAIGVDDGDFLGWTLDSYYLLNNDIDCSDTAGWNNIEVTEGGVGTGDDEETVFSFGFKYIDEGETVSIYIDSVLQDEEDYTINYSEGTVTFDTPPVDGLEVTADFYYFQGFLPIGWDVDYFTGFLDGDGYVVNDLFIQRNIDYVGLISSTEEGSEIRDLGLEDVDIDGASRVGGLVGENYGIIRNSYTTGVINGNSEVGGLAGDIGYAGRVYNSYSTSNVTGSDGTSAGGLAGESDGRIYDSYATGTVSSSGDRIGGLVGRFYIDGVISNSYATGNVSGDDYVGGLVGAGGGIVQNSYATGNVSGDDQIGGLWGRSGGVILNSYATGNVSGDDDVGGLLGYDSDGVFSSNSFWDTETSGEENSAAGEGKTTAQMKNIATYASWDLNYVWNKTTGEYPTLNQNGGFIGEGTEEDPYEINSCVQLQNMFAYFDSHFILMDDIDCSDTENWNNGEGFLPIGIDDDEFEGVLDGNEHTITGLYIDREENNLGLIGRTDESEIKNIGLIDVYVNGHERCDIGGLIGYSEDSVIMNVYTTGTVSGGCDVGGLIGYSEYDDISNSYSTADVTGTSNSIGGFVGYSEYSEIDSSYSLGDVVGDGNQGGFAGYLYEGVISNAYAKGTVTGIGGAMGGFIGYNQGDIYYAYSTGVVINTNEEAGQIGGFVGRNNSYIYSSFSTGSVTAEEGSARVGGFIGWNNNDVAYQNSGWWTGAGPLDAIGYDSEEDDSITEIAYNESDISAFKNQNHALYNTSDEGYDIWDFEGVWSMNGEDNDGFPFFWWQGFEEEEPEEEPIDVCPNIAGNQATIPTGHKLNKGNCVKITSGGGSGGSLVKLALISTNDTIPTDCLPTYLFSPSTGKSCGINSSTNQTTSAPSVFKFLKNLSLNMINADVQELQKYLNSRSFILAINGPGSTGNETNKFGPLTKAALIKFQVANNIKPAVGFFGPITRGVVNK